MNSLLSIPSDSTEKSFSALEIPLVSPERIKYGKILFQVKKLIICEVKESSPPRIYRIFPREELQKDEIRILQQLTEKGNIPRVYQIFRSFLAIHEFIFIEMDHVKSMCYSDQPFKEEDNINEIMSFPPSPIRRAKIEKVILQCFGNSEAFFIKLFSRIKELAELKIAYVDTHVDNLIRLNNEIGFVNFKKAKLMEDSKSAIIAALKSPSNIFYLIAFSRLTHLSPEGNELRNWLVDLQVSKPV